MLKPETRIIAIVAITRERHDTSERPTFRETLIWVFRRIMIGMLATGAAVSASKGSDNIEIYS